MNGLLLINKRLNVDRQYYDSVIMVVSNTIPYFIANIMRSTE
jgi:hypothetical protein